MVIFFVILLIERLAVLGIVEIVLYSISTLIGGAFLGLALFLCAFLLGTLNRARSKFAFSMVFGCLVFWWLLTPMFVSGENLWISGPIGAPISKVVAEVGPPDVIEHKYGMKGETNWGYQTGFFGVDYFEFTVDANGRIIYRFSQ